MGLSLHISIVPVIMMVVSLQVWLPLGCVEEERTALLQLKDSLNYPNGTSLPSWRKGDARCCDWDGVGCSTGTGRVTTLFLYRVRNGELGDWYLNASLFLPFQELITLDLSDNQIAGWVENKGVYQPFKLSKLEDLYLRDNQLDNSILSYMDGLSSLKSLYLDYNRLKGLIDLKEWSSDLDTLCLSGNNITKVVASRGSTNVSTLYPNDITAYGSSFQTLLQSLGAFPNLTELYLGNNDLRGRISGDELRNLRSLEGLNLDGCFQDENSLQILGALPSLRTLSLQALSGIVLFQGFLNLKNLELLDLSYNTLNSNSIFRTIGAMNSLKTLWLQGCSFNGQLPISQAVFSVAHNNLSGKTPARVAQFATFEESSYKDNPFLCGQPLTKACDANMPSSPMSTPTSTNIEEKGGFMDMEVFYVSFGVAYIMVLLAIGAILYIYSYWRLVWFHFIEVSITNCYYFMVDNLTSRSKFGFS